MISSAGLRIDHAARKATVTSTTPTTTVMFEVMKLMSIPSTSTAIAAVITRRPTSVVRPSGPA